MTKKHSETASRFSRQAGAYAESAPHARGGDLDVVEAFAAPRAEERALDVATGPGHTAFRLAARCRHVVAVDIAPGMIAAARALAGERGIANVAFAEAEAAALPFAAGAFDVVTCRIAPHHFADVPGFLLEVVRVLAPGGRLVLEDSLAPDDCKAALFLEAIERQRDPTHVHSLSHREWHEAVAAAGLGVVRERQYRKRQDFEAWMHRSGLDEPAVADVARRILAAPAHLRERLFDVRGNRVVALHDVKLILRAEPATPEGAVVPAPQDG